MWVLKVGYSCNAHIVELYQGVRKRVVTELYLHGCRANVIWKLYESCVRSLHLMLRTLRLAFVWRNLLTNFIRFATAFVEILLLAYHMLFFILFRTYYWGCTVEGSKKVKRKRKFEITPVAPPVYSHTYGLPIVRTARATKTRIWVGCRCVEIVTGSRELRDPRL